MTRGAIYWHFKDKSDLFAAMVNRVTLPMEAMVARSSDESVEDPLASLKECAVSALKRTATDPQCQRVFDVVTHKCEYLGEMAGVARRISSIQKGCVDRSEQAIRNAVKRGHVAGERESAAGGNRPRRHAVWADLQLARQQRLRRTRAAGGSDDRSLHRWTAKQHEAQHPRAEQTQPEPASPLTNL